MAQACMYMLYSHCMVETGQEKEREDYYYYYHYYHHYNIIIQWRRNTFEYRGAEEKVGK